MQGEEKTESAAIFKFQAYCPLYTEGNNLGGKLMSDKTFKILLGAALLFFAVYVITDISIIGIVGGGFLLLIAFVRVVSDWRNGRLSWQKNKKKISYTQKRPK